VRPRPGQENGDALQIAWECNDDGSPDHPTLWDNALVRGLLPGHLSVVPTADEADTSVYVRLQWTATPPHPWWNIFLQLGFRTEVADAAALQTRLATVMRPRNPADVPRWLGAVGAHATA
jgi:hypothetical protein